MDPDPDRGRAWVTLVVTAAIVSIAIVLIRREPARARVESHPVS
jgi:hypothetical protein